MLFFFTFFTFFKLFTILLFFSPQSWRKVCLKKRVLAWKVLTLGFMNESPGVGWLFRVPQWGLAELKPEPPVGAGWGAPDAPPTPGLVSCSFRPRIVS